MFAPGHLPNLARRIVPLATGLLILSSTSGGLPIQESIDRTIDVRVVNDDVEVVVDGESIPAERIRRTDFGMVVLDESGDPIPGLRIEMAAPGGMAMLTEEATSSARPVMLGIMMEQTPKGVGIIEVVPGTPAASAGLRPGDVILSKEDAVLTPDRLGEMLRGFNPGEVVAMRVLRDGDVEQTRVRLEAWNDRMMNGASEDVQRSESTVEMRFETDGTPSLDSLQRMVGEAMGLRDFRPAESRASRDDHDWEIGPERIIEVLRRHLPELFRDGDVSIEVEGHDDGFEIEIEVGLEHEGDHEEHDRHHDDEEHWDEERWEEERWEEERWEGHRDEHDGERFHEEHRHHAEAMFEEMHHGMEDFAHEIHERMEAFAREAQERFEMMERAIEERIHHLDRSREEMARHVEEAFEQTHHRLEEEFRRRDQRFQEAADEIGNTFRRIGEHNQRLEQRLQRLEAAMRMNRGHQDDRHMNDRERQMQERQMQERQMRERQMRERQMRERQMREGEMREGEMRERGRRDRNAEGRNGKASEGRAKNRNRREDRKPDQPRERRQRDTDERR